MHLYSLKYAFSLTMLTSDMELTLDTCIVIPTSTGLPEYIQTHELVPEL